jgi:carboxymethylenebutenolidase
VTTITIDATDGSGKFEAYVAEPPHTPAGAVVLIQEIFGVNESMKQTAAWIADLGFWAIVPDLFWRLQPGISLTDKTKEEFDQALAYMQRFDQRKGIEDLKATLAAARKHPGANGRAGTVGYCLGGRLAMMMAEESDADINISYYGVGLDGLLDGLASVHAPLLLHIADKDGFFPPEGRAKLVEAVKDHPHARAYVYKDADHAFARVNGIHWQGIGAAIANGRTAEALAAALV